MFDGEWCGALSLSIYGENDPDSIMLMWSMASYTSEKFEKKRKKRVKRKCKYDKAFTENNLNNNNSGGGGCDAVIRTAAADKLLCNN